MDEPPRKRAKHSEEVKGEAISSRFSLNNGKHIDIFFFQKVSNVTELVKLMDDNEIQASVLNPDYVVSSFQLQAAAYHCTSTTQLKAKTIFSELLFTLSPNNHIPSLTKLMPQPEQTAIFLVTFDKEETELADILTLIKGNRARLEEGYAVTDNKLTFLMKTYKISKEELTLDEVSQEQNLINALVSRNACRRST